MKYLVIAVLALIGLMGCATLSPNGRYMQFFAKDGKTVTVEYTHVTGMKACSLESIELMRQHPTLMVKCTNTPTEQPLPYGFTVRNLLNMDDGFQQSSSYPVKVFTRNLCESMMAGYKSNTKIRIVESHC